MKKTMYKNEKVRQVTFYNKYLSDIAKNNGYFRGNHDFVLKRDDCLYNLYEPIRQNVCEYFNKYHITWWGENKRIGMPTGHLVSSQIHCLNHLFALRKDKEVVKSLLENATKLSIKDILPSPLDEDGYITFEFVHKNITLLGEKNETRGAKCTSIDAFVYALLNCGRKILVPIEWKYTETYSGIEAKEESLQRYPNRILPTSNLNGWNNLYKTDPYYELMRQTLLVEQIIENPNKVDIEAGDYVHLVIIPKKHTELRDAITANYEPTLKDLSKFHIIDPQDLLEPIQGYDALKDYLNTRYWQ